ncbi:hypothetical protein MPTK1_2g26000 [Marchantia polymorpha subsp. ruderalis]|uniref:Uncharacterized protein n=1 Tax=Marchantia polymorpha TaxID=3197 RepID=A0A2R6XBA9_MARPO|nr:hypothetical protein MARPO_0025s0078 [Marchantia polymorpha]BBN03744.1 hypothetical protein Mp_2g26000 [Marchantia polymorpha subsp. ruderalis]|eukprot:PTQ43388.1 hypothetical protein MARPO_0025s0078 [Marchantia polymorpha]
MRQTHNHKSCSLCNGERNSMLKWSAANICKSHSCDLLSL